MGKYDSLRKSQAPSHGAHGSAPDIRAVPSVCPSLRESDGSDATQGSDQRDDALTLDLWDSFDGLDDMDDLPVPELEDETRIVARRGLLQAAAEGSDEACDDALDLSEIASILTIRP